MSERDANRQAWDNRVRRGQRFARPIGDAEFTALSRNLDPLGWLGNVAGKQLLCLAAGGGRHGPLYAAAGAHVTVVDLSPAQLEWDRQVACDRGLQVRTVQTSMDDLSMFAPAEFDLVVHPVSTCYVADVEPTYSEVARVIRSGGVYVSQHKQPASLQAADQPTPSGYELTETYYRSGPLPSSRGTLHREEGTLEFLHSWRQLIGAMCRAGFVIADLVEPNHARPTQPPGSFGHRSCYVPPYVRIKAIRSGDARPGKAATIVLAP